MNIMSVWKSASECWKRTSKRIAGKSALAAMRLRGLARSTKGQGTTEYAILVGVLVVIAILAIVVFRPRLQELWNAIAEGIGQL